RRHPAGAVRDEERYLRVRLAARDGRPLRPPGPRAGPEEARGARAPDADDHDRARHERAHLRPGVHLGRRTPRRGERGQPHSGLPLLGALRGSESQEVSYSLGIDIGGTFTDIVVYDHARGRQLNRKVLTTHDDPAREVAAGAKTLVDAGVTSIAIVFLHAYANGKHEAEAARAIARRHRGIAITTSHEVAPEIREYERASTTVANAYIKPLARKYLDA